VVASPPLERHGNLRAVVSWYPMPCGQEPYVLKSGPASPLSSGGHATTPRRKAMANRPQWNRCGHQLQPSRKPGCAIHPSLSSAPQTLRASLRASAVDNLHVRPRYAIRYELTHATTGDHTVMGAGSCVERRTTWFGDMKGAPHVQTSITKCRPRRHPGRGSCRRHRRARVGGARAR
jgi:hypothetical protein